MFAKLTLAIAICGLAAHGFSQAAPIITIKHLELLPYPNLARLARLQGSISIHFKDCIGRKRSGCRSKHSGRSVEGTPSPPNGNHEARAHMDI